MTAVKSCCLGAGKEMGETTGHKDHQRRDSTQLEWMPVAQRSLQEGPSRHAPRGAG